MVGIGCGIISLLGIIVVGGMAWYGMRKAKEIADEFANNPGAAAEMIIKMHPELDHVSTDADAGTITVRNKQNGEEMVVNFSDIEKGNFSVQGANGDEVFSVDSDSSNNGITISSGDEGVMKIGGDADLADVPKWVPIYPDTVKSTTAMHRTRPDGKATGMVTFEVNDEVGTISEHYQNVLKEQGFEVDVRSVNANGNVSQAVVTASHPENSQALNILIGEADGKRSLMINYEEK